MVHNLNTHSCLWPKWIKQIVNIGDNIGQCAGGTYFLHTNMLTCPGDLNFKNCFEF